MECSRIEYLNIIIISVQAVTTIVLVVITGYYAKQTRKQNDLSVIPIVVAESFSMNKKSLKRHAEYICTECILENIGNGPAQHISISFHDTENGKKVFESAHFIDLLKQKDKEKAHIHIPYEEFKKIRFDTEGSAYFFVKIEYKDFTNKMYISSKKFDLHKDSLAMNQVGGTFKFLSNFK